ncbi:hypothetical protein Droror1_Dr00016485 [Drosera rotundifolia]
MTNISSTTSFFTPILFVSSLPHLDFSPLQPHHEYHHHHKQRKSTKTINAQCHQQNNLTPISQNHKKSFLTGSVDAGVVKDNDLWSKMMEEIKLDVEQEPILSNYYNNSIYRTK